MTRLEATRDARPDTMRAGALIGAAGIAALANQVGVSTGIVHRGAWGGLLAAGDLAPVVLLMAAGWWLYREASAGTAGLRGSLLRVMLTTYAAWWAVLLFVAVSVKPHASAGQWLATALIFRDPRSQGPIVGLGIGPLVLSAVLFAVVAPLLARFLRSRPSIERVSIGAMVATAIAFRAVLAAGGHTSAYGPLSWLPNHLDGLAAGMALAALSGARGRLSRPGLARTGGALLVAAALLVVRGSLLDRGPVPEGTGAVLAHSLLALGVAAALGLVSLVRGPWPLDGGRRVPVVQAMAVAAPGLVLCAGAAFVMIARRYRVEVVEVRGGVLLEGPAAGPFLWSLAVAAATGILLTLLISVGRAVSDGRRPAPGFALLLASVVSAGLIIRLAGLLSVAPERTDAGDARFYHTTANLLAHGRGFAEPLHWIAFQQYEPSALHGPLYSVVLSASSRLGASDWFDHKMLSVLIGTATVLAAGLVGWRVGGRIAAVLAAALAAVYPNLWLLDSLLFPEGLFALLVMLAVLIAYRWRDRPGLILAAAFGALLGLAGLTRGEGLLLIPLLAVPWILRTGALGMRSRVRHLAVAVIACLVVLAPWTVRNAVTFTRFVPVSTNSDELLVYANCADTYGGRLLGYWSFACQERIRQELGDPPGDASEQAAYWRRTGLEYAKDHLGAVPKVIAARIGRQWELFRPGQNIELGTIEGRNRRFGQLGLAMYYALAAGSLLAIPALRRRRRKALAAGSNGAGAGAGSWPLAVQFVCVTLTAVYAYGNIRFRAPVEPVLCVLAAVAAAPWVARLWSRVRRAAT